MQGQHKNQKEKPGSLKKKRMDGCINKLSYQNTVQILSTDQGKVS